MLEAEKLSGTNGCGDDITSDQELSFKKETFIEVGLQDELKETCIEISESADNFNTHELNPEGFENDPNSAVSLKLDFEGESEAIPDQNAHSTDTGSSKIGGVKWSSNLETCHSYSISHPVNRGEQIIQLVKNFQCPKLNGWIVTAVLITVACIFCVWFFNYGVYLVFASRLKQSRR